MIKYQLAAAILAIWEDDIRRFAPDEHLRWQTLLEALPDDLSPEQLRDALAPLAAKSDKEQAIFIGIFERAKAEVAAMNAGDTDLSAIQHLKNVDPKTPQRSFWKKYGYWMAAAGLFLALIWVVSTFSQRKQPVFQQDISVTPGQKSLICPGNLSALDTFSDRVSGVSVQYAKTNTVLQRSQRNGGVSGKQEGIPSPAPPTLISDLAVIQVENDTCLAYTAQDSVQGTDSLVLRIQFSKGQQCDLQLRVFVSPPVETDTVISDTGQARLLEPHEPPFDHDQLIRNLEFKPGNPFLIRWGAWLKVGILLLLAGLLYWLVQYRARRRQKLVAQRDKSAKPPYVWNIRIKNLAPPDPGEAFGLTINSLRRRTDDDTQLIDVPATVRATIRKGGMVAFRFRQQTRPPEYLMLVDRQNAHDHRARLFDDLYHILRQNEVLTERFFFDGDIRLCYNEQYPEGLTPDEMQFRFPAHRLLIIGTGRQLFSATTGKLAKWTEQFARWKDRALLSPLPAVEWGRRERALADLFRFAPATMPGVRRLIEAFDADEEFRVPQFDKLAALAVGEPVLLEAGDLRQTLEKHYPDELTRTWLASCALWPELHYDLTLWLGHWLAQESGQPVATMARLSDLLRLPWFATGEMPDAVRAVLLDWLRETNPALENSLRTALHSLLEENGPPPDSASWDDFAMRVAFNEWQFTTDPKVKKEREAQIARWIEQNGDPDFIVIRELTGKPGPLDSLLPDSWKKRLFKGKLPGLGLREVWKDVMGIVLPVLVVAGTMLFLFWRTEATVCQGVQGTVVVGTDTITICETSDEGKLLIWEYRMRKAAAQQLMGTFTALNTQFPVYSDTALQLLAMECRANAANTGYNTGVLYYTTADSLERLKEDTDYAKQEACRWFNSASAIDTTLDWVRRAQDWCMALPLTATGERLGVCRIVADEPILLVRNRPRTQAELNKVDKNSSIRLHALATLPAGAQVQLLDSVGAFYQVDYKGTIGYVVKMNFGKPALLPCRKISVITPAIEPILPEARPVPPPEMISVIGKSFTMGSPGWEEDRSGDEKQHTVTLSDYAIGRTEITNEQFFAFMNEIAPKLTYSGSKYFAYNGYEYYLLQEGTISFEKGRFVIKEGYKNHPAVRMSWYAAKDYCRWLSEKTGKKYRLPSEAEWEYAARGGHFINSHLYAGSNNIDDVAWYKNNMGNGPHAVGTKRPNAIGLYDMSGNVYEWCADQYKNNESETAGSANRVTRGGSCFDEAKHCRVANRNFVTPATMGRYIGFRVASSPSK